MNPKQLFGRFADHEELTELLRANAIVLCARVSELMSHYGKELEITSGFRPKSYNKQIGGSENSKHCFCQAVDLWDPDKKFGQWCVLNKELLHELGLYMESLETTHKSDKAEERWCHLQSIGPRSVSVIFKP